MSKLIVVIGATGIQGGSVVSRFLKDKNFKVRGITRNVESKKAKALALQGVEVVQADVNDEASLLSAFKGAFAVYGVTDFANLFATLGPEGAMEQEYQQGVNMAKAASKTPTLEHFVWSTLPYSEKLSGGKVVVPHFDGKARVDEFIKSDPELLRKTTFLYLAFYPTNYQQPMLAPFYWENAQRYVQLIPCDSDKTPLYSIGETSVNVGIWVHAILTSKKLPARPADKPSLYILGSHKTYPSNSAVLESWVRSVGEKHTLKSTQSTVFPVTLEQYGQIWGPWGTEVGLMYKFWEQVKERSWTTAGKGDALLPVQEIMDETALADQVGTEESFKAIEWNI